MSSEFHLYDLHNDDALDDKAVLHSEPANVGLGKDEAVKPNASDTTDVLLGGRTCLDILNFNLAHVTDGTLHARWRKRRHAICFPMQSRFRVQIKIREASGNCEPSGIHPMC